MGATMKEVLSPTPPVECLSTANLPSGDGSKVSPENLIAVVRECNSAALSPRMNAAISHAASCGSVMHCGISGRVCNAAPATTN